MERKGLLLVNGFLKGNKYDEVYSFLVDSFLKFGCKLVMKPSYEISNKVGYKPVIDKNEADFVIFWDKDHYLAKAISDGGIRVFNNYRAVRDCDNKILTAKRLADGGVNTPKTIIAPKTFENIGYTSFDFLKKAGDELGYPFVIKEAYGSFGEQVYLAKDHDEAVAIVKGFGGKEFLMQEFIKESCGRDIRVNVVGKSVVASMLRVNEKDFRSNITGGGKAYATDITEKQKSAAIAALNAVNADFGGVDILLNEGEPMVCEVNASMHFVSTFNATGVNVADYIAEYVIKEIYG